jgi:hypothetical protein
MAITATNKFIAHNRMRYLINATVGSGEAVNITGTDLLLLVQSGPLANILGVKARGYGKLAAGTTITQAIARALFLSDDAVSVVGTGVPTAIAQITGRSGTGGPFLVDAAQDAGDTLLPMYTITAVPAGACSGYLDIEVPGAIGA